MFLSSQTVSHSVWTQTMRTTLINIKNCENLYTFSIDASTILPFSINASPIPILSNDSDKVRLSKLVGHGHSLSILPSSLTQPLSRWSAALDSPQIWLLLYCCNYFSSFFHLSLLLGNLIQWIRDAKGPPSAFTRMIVQLMHNLWPSTTPYQKTPAGRKRHFLS